MAKTIKIRAYERDGQVTVRSIIKHPMETGFRKIKKTGKKRPPNYIQEVVVSRNRQVVMEAFWGKSISRNPFLSFQISGRKGDAITIAWIDNRGNSDTETTSVR